MLGRIGSASRRCRVVSTRASRGRVALCKEDGLCCAWRGVLMTLSLVGRSPPNVHLSISSPSDRPAFLAQKNGLHSTSRLVEAPMMKSHGWKHTAVLLFLAATAIVSPAQTFTAIHSFNGNGASPFAGLVLATDGNLYGTTTAGGAYFAGTVFKITPTGRLTTIYSFCPNKYDCSDGLLPDGKLVQATDGNLYGTTLHGGPDEWGTIFKITPEGTLTTLHTFDYSDGGFPNAGLMQATEGNLYGSSSGAGTYNWGTIFRMNLDGTLATLYNFCSQMNCSDGS